MPRKSKPRRKSGDTRTVPIVRKPAATRLPAVRDTRHSLRTQIRGGRPPRFPGRTGGR